MNLTDVLTKLEDLPFAVAIREGARLFPWIESIHVIAITLVVGSIIVVDLRLIGLAWVSRSVQEVEKELLPATWVAFVVAVISGAFLFSSNAVKYWSVWDFRIKLLLILCAGINMLVFNFVTNKTVTNWGASATPPQAARVAGALSIILWCCVIGFGRWVGFDTQN